MATNVQEFRKLSARFPPPAPPFGAVIELNAREVARIDHLRSGTNAALYPIVSTLNFVQDRSMLDGVGSIRPLHRLLAHLHIPGEPKENQKTQQQEAEIDLPPEPLIASHAGLGMMIVVPALAAGDDGDKNIVAAVIAGVVVLVTGRMSQRIYAPGDVPDKNGSDDDSPEPYARAELRGLHNGSAEREPDQKHRRVVNYRLRKGDPHHITFDPAVKPVANDVARVAVVGHVAAKIGVV